MLIAASRGVNRAVAAALELGGEALVAAFDDAAALQDMDLVAASI